MNLFECSLCSSNCLFISHFTLQMRGELNTHNLIHTNAKNFICTECGLGFRTKMAMDSHTLRKHTNLKPRFGFCVLNFLSNLSDFLSREKLTHKKSCAILQNFNSWMLKFTVKQEKPYGKIVVWVKSIKNWSFPKILGFFGVSFSRERKSERIERKFKTQNLKPSIPCEECGKLFRVRSDLYSHAMTHKARKERIHR